MVKRLAGETRRELAIYKALRRSPAAAVMPQLVGFDDAGPDTYMYIEWVPAASGWPWRDTSASAAVLARLAQIHSCRLVEQTLLRRNFEKVLLDSAESTLRVISEAATSGSSPVRRPMIRTVERMVTALPAVRTLLRNLDGYALIHGDAHSANVILRAGTSRPDAVLIDWGRARLGSPLEDASSWLQSLGYWEYEVRRRHDSLLRSYLAARGVQERLTSELRQLYWFACASNAMAGALRYHLLVSMDTAHSGEKRQRSARVASDWLRMVRRADACLKH